MSTVGTATNDDFLVLHGLAVKKHGTSAAVAEVLGREEHDVAAALDQAAGAGEVMGAKGIYMLTPKGQQRLADTYPERYAELRGNEAFLEGYARFERVNRQLLQLFTDWQTREVGGQSVPNDHTDERYDAAIVDRLGELHEHAEQVLGDLQQSVQRLGRYTERLEMAYDRVLAGDQQYVSAVKVDSYHTVWFELHEDLLRMLGREREE